MQSQIGAHEWVKNGEMKKKSLSQSFSVSLVICVLRAPARGLGLPRGTKS